MYKKKAPQMSMFEKPENFVMSHGLSPDNRWIRMAKLIPWDTIEKKYAKNFKDTPFSRPAKPARMALGTLIIKERCGLSDEDTVEMIRENPYMQYFIGLDSFAKEVPMDPSLLTHFRKRITPGMLMEINDHITEEKSDDDRHATNHPKDDWLDDWLGKGYGDRSGGVI